MPDILSVVALAILFLGCLAPIIKAYRLPSDYSPLEKLLYAPVYCVGRLLWRIEIVRIVDGNFVGTIATEDLKTGRSATLKQYQTSDRKLGVRGAIIVANHRNSLDPFFVQLACGRRVHWMVAGEYFKNPVFGPVLRTFQAIPTNRSGADSASLKTAMRLAGEGRLVGMFPEGRINRTQKPLLKIRTGAGLVALKANSPLLPCWIDGAPQGWDVWSGWFTAARIKIFVGDPIPCCSRLEEESSILEDPKGTLNTLNNNYHTNLSTSDSLTVLAMTKSLQLGGHPEDSVQLARTRGVSVKP